MARDPFEQPEEAIRRLYAYVAYRIGSGPDAEDVVSETLERALRYRSSYRESAGPPMAWLVGIANRCIATARRDAARTTGDGVVEATTTSGDFVTALAERADVQAAVARLEPRERELIGLRYGADLKAREIGRLLDMSTGAVEVALHRAIGRLRVILDTPLVPEDGAGGPARVLPEREPA
jgi:RNA polymerase sigma-70 factor (ECF subfamily)